jgi:putative BNR repeat neuraminidase
MYGTVHDVRESLALRTALMLALACSLLSPAGSRAASAAEIAHVGAWCWFGDPRAIAYDDRVVFGWVAGDGSIMAGDDRGTSFPLQSTFERDDHDNPAFYVRRDGRLMAFWSGHSGDAIHYRVAVDAGLRRWGPVRTGPANPPGWPSQYTYPTPVRAGRTLYLFWSGANNTATYATSSDDGDSWSRARPLFVPDLLSVRYVKYKAYGDEIHMAWSLVHPRWIDSGIHHAVIRDGVVRRQDGTAIGRLGELLDPQAGDLVYRPETDGGAWIHDLELDRGRPVIAYATFPTIANHSYRSARWAGRWVDERVAMAGPTFDADPVRPEEQYSGGIAIDPRDPATLYLSRQVAGQFELERWWRTPRGWRHVALTSALRQLNVRPFPVAGGVAWMRGSYPGFRDFQTALVWLDRDALAARTGRTPR